MFHKILAAIDNSDLSQCVFNDALALAKSTSAHLVLLNVLSTENEASPQPPILSGYELYPNAMSYSIVENYQDLWKSYAERELEMLRSLANQATAAGVETTFRQSFGSPSRIICEIARDLDVDLIIVGRHGRSGLNELILGSVSNYVLHHAPCSVLTIHRQPQHTLVSAEANETKQVANVS